MEACYHLFRQILSLQYQRVEINLGELLDTGMAQTQFGHKGLK